ncbi:hypothetical protein [Phytohabitans rumicis]|uniref:Ferredoxin n=1 Tax=Phytohabitans rumicis TaxID=1076125 RepID=A0A6V8LGP7_9ACTN|nr:hypothetical protein [Phytohabitans rumicis]GFJ96423.1 hypothetical protein Prum_100650 [Phytohabitans rumicis]
MSETRTLDDRRAYLEGGLVDLACGHCSAWVRVKKSSPPHTSVQWSREAVRACAEFAGSATPNALIRTCARLRDSIEHAARAGYLEQE